MTQRLLPDPEIDALIRKLNQEARVGPERDAPIDDEPPRAPAPAAEARFELPEPSDDARGRLERLLDQARQLHASDLLLAAGSAPVARVHGRLSPLDDAVLAPAAVGALCAALVPASRRAVLASRGVLDFSTSRAKLGRFRCNVHRERDGWAAAVRLLPEEAPELEALLMPPSVARFAELEHGLVLVTGPTGSGKSTTLAALVRRILTRRNVHLITIEDPVEYTHPHAGSLLEHVEIGRDADSFATALRSVLRQDPDVLLIGEMRDAESIGIAITAAETGHLVLATLHTGDAPQSVHRILDSYPGTQAETVRVQLSISLAGIISQQLLPRRDGGGRVPAVEVLVATHAVRNLIRSGKIAQLRSQLTLERSAGMLSLDASLAELVTRGLVDVEQARPRARVPEEFDGLLRAKR